MTEKFTFDDLPMAVSQLTDKVNSIYSMLARHSMPQESPQTEDKLLSVREASTLLRLTVPTIYSKVSRGELPCMKQGNRLYFSLSEITAHLKSGKKTIRCRADRPSRGILQPQGRRALWKITALTDSPAPLIFHYSTKSRKPSPHTIWTKPFKRGIPEST